MTRVRLELPEHRLPAGHDEDRRPGTDRRPTTRATRRSATTWLPAIGGILLVAVVGCGDGSGGGAEPGPGPARAADAGAAGHDMAGMQHDMPGMQQDMSGMQHGDTGGSGGGHHGSGAAEIWSVQSAVGDLATDGSGRILYRSDADTTSPSASRCVGTCPQEWQPFTVPAGQRPGSLGVDDHLVGTLKRPDGAVQVTLAGAPLYTHRGDDGQLASRADAGGWHAVTPQGGKAARTGS